MFVATLALDLNTHTQQKSTRFNSDSEMACAHDANMPTIGTDTHARKRIRFMLMRFFTWPERTSDFQRDILTTCTQCATYIIQYTSVSVGNDDVASDVSA